MDMLGKEMSWMGRESFFCSSPPYCIGFQSFSHTFYILLSLFPNNLLCCFCEIFLSFYPRLLFLHMRAIDFCMLIFSLISSQNYFELVSSLTVWDFCLGIGSYYLQVQNSSLPAVLLVGLNVELGSTSSTLLSSGGNDGSCLTPDLKGNV